MTKSEPSIKSRPPFKVSIGISAYNEETNIFQILTDVLSQTEDSWKMLEILLYLDGCTDSTFQVASQITDHRLHIIRNLNRRGKAFRVSQMFHEFTGDILVMLDADIRIGSSNVISDIVKEFQKDQKVMLVSGNPQPFRPKTFFEQAVYTSFQVFYTFRKQIRSGHNIYSSSGQILAINKLFAKTINLPKVNFEDAYLYLYCKSLKYTFRSVSSATVYYRMSDNLKDYLQFLFKYQTKSLEEELSKYFGPLVSKELNRPTGVYIKSLWLVFIENPWPFVVISFIHFFKKPLRPLVSKYPLF